MKNRAPKNKKYYLHSTKIILFTLLLCQNFVAKLSKNKASFEKTKNPNPEETSPKSNIQENDNNFDEKSRDSLEKKKENLIRRVIEGGAANDMPKKETKIKSQNEDILKLNFAAKSNLQNASEYTDSNDQDQNPGIANEPHITQSSDDDESLSNPQTDLEANEPHNKLGLSTPPQNKPILQESLIDEKLNSNNKDLQSLDLDILSDIIASNPYKVDSGTRFSGLKIIQNAPKDKFIPKMRTCMAKIPRPLNIEPPANFRDTQIELELAELHRPELYKSSPSKVEISAHLGSIIFQKKVFVLYKSVIRATAQTEVVGINFPLEMQVFGREVRPNRQEDQEFHQIFEKNWKKKADETDSNDTDKLEKDKTETQLKSEDEQVKQHIPSTGIIISILFEESQYADAELYQMGFGTGKIQEMTPGESTTVSRFNLRDFLGDSMNKFMFWKSRNALLARNEPIPRNDSSQQSKSTQSNPEGLTPNSPTEFIKTRFCSTSMDLSESKDDKYLDIDEVSWDETLWLSMFVTIDISKLQSQELKQNLSNVFKTEMKNFLKDYNFDNVSVEKSENGRVIDKEYLEPAAETDQKLSKSGSKNPVISPLFQNFDPDQTIVQLIRNSWVDPALVANQLLDFNLPLARFSQEEVLIQKRAARLDWVKMAVDLNGDKTISKLFLERATQKIGKIIQKSGRSRQINPKSDENENKTGFSFGKTNSGSNTKILEEIRYFEQRFGNIMMTLNEEKENRTLIEKQQNKSLSALKSIFNQKDLDSETNPKNKLLPISFMQSQDFDIFTSPYRDITYQELSTSPVKQSEVFEAWKDDTHSHSIPEDSILPWDFQAGTYDRERIFILKNPELPQSIEESFQYTPLFYYMSPLKMCIEGKILFVPYLGLVEEEITSNLEKPVLSVEVLGIDHENGETSKFRYSKERTVGDDMFENFGCDGRIVRGTGDHYSKEEVLDEHNDAESVQISEEDQSDNDQISEANDEETEAEEHGETLIDTSEKESGDNTDNNSQNNTPVLRSIGLAMASSEQISNTNNPTPQTNSQTTNIQNPNNQTNNSNSTSNPNPTVTAPAQNTQSNTQPPAPANPQSPNPNPPPQNTINIGELGIFGSQLKDAPTPINTPKKTLKIKPKNSSVSIQHYHSQNSIKQHFNDSAEKKDIEQRNLRVSNENAILQKNLDLKKNFISLFGNNKPHPLQSSMQSVNDLILNSGNKDSFSDSDRKNLEIKDFTDVFSGYKIHKSEALQNDEIEHLKSRISPESIMPDAFKQYFEKKFMNPFNINKNDSNKQSFLNRYNNLKREDQILLRYPPLDLPIHEIPVDCVRADHTLLDSDMIPESIKNMIRNQNKLKIFEKKRFEVLADSGTSATQQDANQGSAQGNLSHPSAINSNNVSNLSQNIKTGKNINAFRTKINKMFKQSDEDPPQTPNPANNQQNPSLPATQNPSSVAKSFTLSSPESPQEKSINSKLNSIFSLLELNQDHRMKLDLMLREDLQNSILELVPPEILTKIEVDRTKYVVMYFCPTQIFSKDIQKENIPLYSDVLDIQRIPDDDGPPISDSTDSSDGQAPNPTSQTPPSQTVNISQPTNPVIPSNMNASSNQAQNNNSLPQNPVNSNLQTPNPTASAVTDPHTQTQNSTNPQTPITNIQTAAQSPSPNTTLAQTGQSTETPLETVNSYQSNDDVLSVSLNKEQENQLLKEQLEEKLKARHNEQKNVVWVPIYQLVHTSFKLNTTGWIPFISRSPAADQTALDAAEKFTVKLRHLRRVDVPFKNVLFNPELNSNEFIREQYVVGISPVSKFRAKHNIYVSHLD